MNEQRRVIYRIRRDILSDKGNIEFIQEMVEDVAELLVNVYRPEKNVPIESWPWDEVAVGFKNTFKMHTPSRPKIALLTTVENLRSILPRRPRVSFERNLKATTGNKSSMPSEKFSLATLINSGKITSWPWIM